MVRHFIKLDLAGPMHHHPKGDSRVLRAHSREDLLLMYVDLKDLIAKESGRSV